MRHLSRYPKYDWQPEADGIADPQESFTESRRRKATEIEGAFFKDMRKLAPLIAEALEQTVRPKIRMLEIDGPGELSCYVTRTLTPDQASRYQAWFDNARQLRELIADLEARSLQAFNDAED